MAKEIPVFQRKNINTNVQFGTGSAGVIRQQASAGERLSARLQGDINTLTSLAMPQITQDTINKAQADVKSGNIDSESVALVARDVYKKTAERSFMADVEVNAQNLGSRLVDEQTLKGQFNTQAISSSWSEFTKGTISGIKDIDMKSNIEQRLNNMGKKFQGQVSTLETRQRRGIQKNNLSAKIEMDTEELKKATGVNPERTIELQSEIADTISTMASANFITSNEAEQLHTSINKEAYIDHTQRTFKVSLSKGLDSATKFIEKFDKSNQPLLDEREKLSTINRFESQLSDLRRDAKNTKIAAAKTNKIDVNDGIRVLNSGKVPDNKILLDAQVKTLSEKEQRDYQKATVVQSVMSKFSDLSLPEMEAYINSSESKTVSDVYGVEVLDEAKKVISNKKKLASSDPISLGIQDGLFEQPTAVTVTDLSGLPERLVLSAITASQYGTSPKLLPSTEAKNFSNYMADPEVTINQKQLLIANINGFGTEIAELMYRQVGGNKAYNFAFAGELAYIGNTNGSKLALQGRNADITLDVETKLKIQTHLKGVFNNFTAETYNQNLRGIKDYVKGLMLTGQDVDDSDILEQTIGKSIKYNGKQTILPFGVKERDFESWLDNIEIPDRPKLTEELHDITDPLFSGNYQLHYAGPGKYMVWNPNNGSGYYEESSEEASKPFLLDWNK